MAANASALSSVPYNGLGSKSFLLGCTGAVNLKFFKKTHTGCWKRKTDEPQDGTTGKIPELGNQTATVPWAFPHRQLPLLSSHASRWLSCDEAHGSTIFQP